MAERLLGYLWASVANEVLSQGTIRLGTDPFEKAELGRKQTACRPIFKGQRIVKDRILASLNLKERRRLKEAVERLDQQGTHTNSDCYALLLRECAHLKALSEGKRLHAHIRRRGTDCEKLLGNLLVHMYGNCRSLKDARAVFNRIHQPDVSSWNIMISAYAHNGNLEFARNMFDKMSQRDVVSWNSMISAYSQNGHSKEALELFHRMEVEGVNPNRITFISVLDACASLAALTQGKKIHARIIDGGFDSHVVVGNALVNMYAKSGSLDDARNVFDQLSHRNVVSWNTMISAYAQNGHSNDALDLFQRMELETVKPNKITFICALQACAGLATRIQGRRIHDSIADNGFESDVVVGTALVNMYGKCGCMDDARSVFDSMPQRNVVSWTAMITVYAQNGHGKEALELFEQMTVEGVKPNMITFISVLDACASLADLAYGKRIHATVVYCGFHSDVVVATALVNMYGRCGSLKDARAVFEKMSQRNVATWNAMIAAYAQNGNVNDARVMFDNMPYRNVVSWTAMITAYAQNGHGEEAFELFHLMKLDGMIPDKITFISVLDACASLAALSQGVEIHASIIGIGFESDVVVGTALVNMYGKCGCLDESRRVFDKISQRNQICWNTMIAAYAQSGHVKEALKLFRQMNLEGVKPDKITFISILFVCSHAGLLDDGWYHFISMNRDHGITATAKHYRCMIDLCGRAGHLEEAEDLIKNMPFESGVVAWMTLLGACRIHGDVEKGTRVAKHVFKLDPKDAAPYILLSNIYAGAGRQEDVAKLRQAMQDRGIKESYHEFGVL